MSYPPLGGYYGSNTGHSAPKYDARYEQEDNQGIYTNGRQQGQYSAYNWSSQNQQSTPVTTQATYESSTAWSNTPSQTSSYDHTRQSNYHRPAQSTTAPTPSYQNPPRDSYGQGTQRLNQLVYASGLEPAQPQNLSNNTTHKSHSQSQNSTPIPPSSVNQTRMKSPVESHNAYYSVQPPPSYPVQYERSVESNPSQHAAVNAAAALAEAVKARNRTSQQSTVSRQKTTSPNVRNTVPAQESISQPTSIYTPHAKPARASAIPENKSSPRNVNTTLSQQPIHQPQGQIQQTPQQQAISTTNSRRSHSIADSINTAGEAERTPDDTSTSQEQMPNFIDPTQVFNPYHREYERRKKEAAEAEAKRKAEAVQQAEEAHKLEQARKTEEAKMLQSASQKSRDSATANSKTKISKKAAGKANAAAKPTGNQLVVGSADDVAAEEMKALMERMISMKSKNPHLFSKLWNDVRENDTTTQSTTTQGEVMRPESVNTNISNVGVQASFVSGPISKTQKPDSKVTKTTPTIPSEVPRNGYKVVVENNPEQLPDLGRYPAGRRIRPPYTKKENSSTANLPLPVQTSDTAPQLMPPTQNVTSATPVHQSAPPAKQPATSVNNAWPEPRRRAVAIAAIHLLKSVPQNKDNPIMARDIAALLEKNPSYLDLCAALEQRGLKFQRTVFAKDLLKTVPDLSDSQAAQLDDPDFAPLGPVTESMTVNLPATAFGISVKAESTVKPKLPKPKSANAITHQEPVLGTKEAAARKRDFADVLDLTNLSDNDDYVMPSKKPRFDSEHQMPEVYQNLQDPAGYQKSPATLNNFVTPSTVTPLRFNTQAAGPRPPPLQPPPGALPINQPTIPPASQSKPKMIIARKVSKAEAVKKTYYDPKTVARDVLIASGRHPSERPLNVHLAGMLNRYIELDSDVSTFDWDAVDPGGPPLRQVDYIDIPATKQKPRKHRTSDNPRTSLLAIENQNELQARRPKAARHDPTLPSPQTALHSGETQTDKLLKSRHTRIVHHEANSNDTTTPNRKVSIDIPAERSVRGSSRSASRSVQNSVEKHVTVMEANPTSSVRRRGRPPGAKNRYPSVSALRHQAQALRINLPAPPVIEPETMPEPRHPEFKCRWRQCKAQLHNLDVLRKHIPKRHTPAIDEAEKHGYICWWKNCSLLKKEDDGIVPTHPFATEEEWIEHIEEEHMQRLAVVLGDGPATTHTDTRIVSSTDPHRFESDRQRYLCDDDGREVTPLIDIDGGRDLPADPLMLMKHYPQGPRNDKEEADVKAQISYLRVHGGKSSDTRRRAVEIMRAMAARKAMIGPGIDRGGCTLINEARRSTFFQNPGIIQIIDAEY